MTNDEVMRNEELGILKNFEAVEIEDLERFDSILKDGLVHRPTLLVTPQPEICKHIYIINHEKLLYNCSTYRLWHVKQLQYNFFLRQLKEQHYIMLDCYISAL
jgi:hypothetical protein